MFERTFSFWKRLAGKTTGARPGSAEKVVDRRLWIRYASDATASVFPAGGEQTLAAIAQVRDISVGGANLLVDRSIPLGQLLTLELPRACSGTHTVTACVVRVSPHHANQWNIGCVFSRELAEDDIEAFGASKVRNAPGDKRLWKRYSTDRMANVQRLDDPHKLTLQARVVNLSASGAGLVVDAPIEAGTLLNIEFASGDGATKRCILACVVHTKSEAEGLWALGCTFIRELAEEDLKALT